MPVKWPEWLGKPSLPRPSCLPALTRSREPEGAGAYDNGLTAWQSLSAQDYKFLKRTHGWRLDRWNRIQLISWSGTLLLRFATYKDRAGRDVTAKLGPDGMMSIEEFISYEMNCVLKATRWDVEKLVGEQKKSPVHNP